MAAPIPQQDKAISSLPDYLYKLQQARGNLPATINTQNGKTMLWQVHSAGKTHASQSSELNRQCSHLLMNQGVAPWDTLFWVEEGTVAVAVRFLHTKTSRQLAGS
jgi:hypothetical protein